jgi:AbrB family looped-hinge helix DNA binding protein
MDQALTIDSAGRIVLPSAVRRALNLTAGSRLRLDLVAQRIELTPEPEPDASDGLLRRPGQRTVLRPTGRPSDAAALIRAERDAQANRATKRGG